MKKQAPVHINVRLLISMLPIAFLYCLLAGCRSDADSQAGEEIIVEATITKWFHRELEQVFSVKEEIPLSYLSFPFNEMNSSPVTIRQKVKDGKVRWVIYSEHPLKIYPPFGTALIMHPGDSVHILYKADYPDYSGSNISALALVDTLALLKDRVRKPHKKYSYNADNLADYLDWHRYLDEKINLLLPVIESFKGQISQAEYDYYKADLIGSAESDRMDAFSALQRAVHDGTASLTNNDLVAIWDTTQNNPSRQWLHTLSEYNGSIYDIYTFTWMELHRQAGFDFSTDSLQSKEVYTRALYNKAKQEYKGQLRERLLARILDEEVILEMGLKNPVTQAILQDYYNQPGYPEFKAWVKKREKTRQQREIKKDKEKKDKEKKAKSKEEQAEEKTIGMKK